MPGVHHRLSLKSPSCACGADPEAERAVEAAAQKLGSSRDRLSGRIECMTCFIASAIACSPEKVSAYATLTLRRQLERDGVDDLIGELVEVNGPPDPDAVARY